MLEFDNIRLDLESYEVPVAELKDALHIDRVSDQISEYENRMQEPDFWNNVEKATEIQQTLGRLKKKVESYNALVAEREDLLALCELANGKYHIYHFALCRISASSGQCIYLCRPLCKGIQERKARFCP